MLRRTLGALLLASPAMAATLTVDDSGGADYLTITAAMDAAVSGDTILIANGNYTEISYDTTNYGGVFKFKKDLDIIGESTDGVLVTSGPNPRVRHAALLMGTGTYNATISNLTIDMPFPGTGGGTLSYAVLNHAYPGYNNVHGTIVASNVVFRLRGNAEKSILYGNSNGMQITLENCVVDFGNSIGRMAYINYAHPQNAIVNSILINADDGGPYGSGGWGSITYTTRTTGSLLGGTGNTTADPLFSNAAAGDYTLQPGSPAIDAGNPSAVYNDTDGSRNDMGATGGPDATLDTGCAPGHDEVTRQGALICLHPSAMVEDTATVAEGATIGSLAIISPRATIGLGAHVHAGAIIGRRVTIGDGATIGPASILGRASTVEDDAELGANVILGYAAHIGQRSHVDDDAVIGSLVHVDDDCDVGLGGIVVLARSATLDADADLVGPAVIGPEVHLHTGVRGNGNLRIRKNATIYASAILQDGVRIGRSATVQPSVTLGEDATLRANACAGVDLPSNGILLRGEDTCAP